jgi:hypothetical protein
MEPNEVVIDEEEVVQRSNLPSAPAPIDRSGMFGVRGGLRDLLGVLGDAFLVQGGADPRYQPRRQMEREADALQNYYGGSEDDQMVGLRELNKINPTRATELQDKTEQARLRKLEKQALASQRDATALLRTEQANQTREKILERIPNLLGGATPQNWPAVRRAMITMMNNRGIPEEARPPIPENWDQSWVDSFGMSPKEKQAATTQRLNATKPRPARNPPRPVQVIGPDGKPRWERPEASIGQEAPTSVRKGGAAILPPANLTLPAGYERRADGIYNKATGKKVKIKPAS